MGEVPLCIRALFAPLLAAALCTVGGTAMARGRSRSSGAARARSSALKRANQIAAGLRVSQQVQAAAQREQAEQTQRASDAAGKLETAESDLKSVKADETQSTVDRKQLEAQLEKDAGYDHPVSRARRAYEKAKADLVNRRNQVRHSATWRSQVEAAEGAGKSHPEVIDLERQMLKDDVGYSNAFEAYSEAEAEYQQQRHALFSKNPVWKDNVEAARHAQATEHTTEGTADGQARRKIIADTHARTASRVAASAAMDIARRQAYLDMLAKRYRIKVKAPAAPSASSSGK